MKAVVKYVVGPGMIEVRDVPEPRVGAGQVKIEVKYVGICGTDVHIYHGDYDCRPPVILGHEFSGVVAEVGLGVKEFGIGDRVVAEPFAVTCGTCLYCRTGNLNLCPQRLSVGSGVDGGMTKYCVMPAARLHVLPDNIGFEVAALVEPLACAVHGVLERTEINPGDVVLITGPGIMGLLCLQLAKLTGATVILAGTARDKGRLELGGLLGADYVINVQEENPVKLIKELTDGVGADVAIECSGAPAAVLEGLRLIRRRGQFTQMGLLGRPVEIELDQVVLKEVRVAGSFASRWISWGKALDLLADKKITLRPLISEILPITQWREGFARFESKEGLKILLRPVD